jgi:hypothetical protein
MRTTFDEPRTCLRFEQIHRHDIAHAMVWRSQSVESDRPVCEETFGEVKNAHDAQRAVVCPVMCPLKICAFGQNFNELQVPLPFRAKTP